MLRVTKGAQSGSTEWKHSRMEILWQQRGALQCADVNADVVWGGWKTGELRREKKGFLSNDRNWTWLVNMGCIFGMVVKVELEVEVEVEVREREKEVGLKYHRNSRGWSPAMR